MTSIFFICPDLSFNFVCICSLLGVFSVFYLLSFLFSLFFFSSSFSLPLKQRLNLSSFSFLFSLPSSPLPFSSVFFDSFSLFIFSSFIYFCSLLFFFLAFLFFPCRSLLSSFLLLPRVSFSEPPFSFRKNGQRFCSPPMVVVEETQLLPRQEVSFFFVVVAVVVKVGRKREEGRGKSASHRMLEVKGGIQEHVKIKDSTLRILKKTKSTFFLPSLSFLFQGRDHLLQGEEQLDQQPLLR